MGFLYYDGVFCSKTSKGCKRPLTKWKEYTLPTDTKNVLNMANTANSADPDETPHCVAVFLYVCCINLRPSQQLWSFWDGQFT